MATDKNGHLQLQNRIGWADIPAVKNGNVVDDIAPNLILRPGPRLIEAVKFLAERFHRTAQRGTVTSGK